MNLTLARVLSVDEEGCTVQFPDEDTPSETRFSKPVVTYGIPIRPTQFVIVDRDCSPPESIFRFSRGSIVQVDDNRLTLEFEGTHVQARLGNRMSGQTVHPGDEVLLKGFNDDNRAAIDQIVDEWPARPELLVQDWFPAMKDAAAREID